jgi:GNAT superfamily N-acetyltransferase
LLVTDDRAEAGLPSVLTRIGGGTISIFTAAPRCRAIVGRRGGWTPSAVTAMIARDLGSLPDTELPGGLTLRRVRRSTDDTTAGVLLEDAVAVALPADDGDGDLAARRSLADHLRSMPASVRLFAAVDSDGDVRATSGSGTFGSQATVIFVNTHPRWRRRGVGHAMTVAAIRAAREAGAEQACLEASDAAIPLYLRLGFEVVSPATQFFRAR